MLVSFERAVADVSGLAISAFRISAVRHSACGVGGKLSIPDCHVPTKEGFEKHAAEILEASEGQISGVSATEFAAEALNLFSAVALCIKPFYAALDCLHTLAEKNEIALVAHDTDLAHRLLNQWINTIEQRGHSTARLRELEIFMYGDERCKTSEVLTEFPDELTSQLVQRPHGGKIQSRQGFTECPLTRAAWHCQLPNHPRDKFDGVVVHGFRRGSTQMGCPTANMDVELQFGDEHPSPCPSRSGVCHVRLPIPGVYAGVCWLHGEKYGCIVNAGFSPHFANSKPTLEVHIFHHFPSDFYGEVLTLRITGLIRPEARPKSFAHLIDIIQVDCESLSADYWRQETLPEEPAN